MTVLQRTIRGIRDSIPAGYIIGRQSRGDGPPELIKLSDHAAHLGATGRVATLNNLSTMIDAMAGNTVGDVLTRTAQGWKAQAAGGGGGSGPNPWFPSTPTPPAAANFTLSATTGFAPTMANLPSGRGIQLKAPPVATGSDYLALMTANGYTPPAAGTDFTVRACIMWQGLNMSGNWNGGVFLQDNAGKLNFFGGRNAGNWVREQYTNINTFSAFTNYGAASTPNSGVPVWVEIQRVGTNFNYSAGFDGENFFLVASESATAFLGPALSSAGVIWHSNAGAVPYEFNVFSWTTSSP